MIKFVLVIFAVIIILFIFRNKAAVTNKKNVPRLNKAIFFLIVLTVIILIITSGKAFIPQILQILKLGLPIITKFIGI